METEKDQRSVIQLSLWSLVSNLQSLFVLAHSPFSSPLLSSFLPSN